ncbi:hypothetical protein M8818_002141 [Zalaria obscura]|uniref:Uncharacterized protein n=1 Tax=Zalaria obscura TaxID=2024903 RepID=A0ACC3SIY2_9PEZI
MENPHWIGSRGAAQPASPILTRVHPVIDFSYVHDRQAQDKEPAGLLKPTDLPPPNHRLMKSWYGGDAASIPKRLGSDEDRACG